MNLVFGQPSATTADFMLDVTSHRPFAEVLAALQHAIEDDGMKVLQEIDPRAALHSVDRVIGGARLLFFFHPRLLARLLELDSSAIVDLPLKLAVFEMPDGSISIRAADPAHALARYGNPALASFGQELSEACRRIMRAAT